jgi:dTDP-4-dehydrorhamnose 3,5-epimerase
VTVTPTSLPGAFLVNPERAEDERGFFARTWAGEELASHGLARQLDLTAVSWNRRRGTLRGLHYQVAPAGEAKLVSCLRGAIHDVAVDVRPGSPTYLRALAVRLDAASLQMLYLAPGLAHGFLTLEDDTLVNYAISGRHSPEHARGLRWDDPALGLRWPATPAVINARDASWPLLEGAHP